MHAFSAPALFLFPKRSLTFFAPRLCGFEKSCVCDCSSRFVCSSAHSSLCLNVCSSSYIRMFGVCVFARGWSKAMQNAPCLFFLTHACTQLTYASYPSFPNHSCAIACLCTCMHLCICPSPKHTYMHAAALASILTLYLKCVLIVLQLLQLHAR